MSAIPCTFLAIGLSAGLLSGLALAEESRPDAAVVELRATISEIVNTRSQASQERAEWASKKEEMSALLDLHSRELALLNEELEKAGQSAGGHEETKKAAAEELAALRTARRAASETVARNAPRMLELARRFPTPLADECENDISALKKWKTGDEPREGLQPLLSILGKAEQFNRRITRGTEVVEDHEVDVLYLGLARAFYANKNGRAGVGEPGTDGWSWQARPDIGGEVLKAFDTLDKKRPPGWVKLPVKLQ